jgi:hypothetical protein
LNSKRNRSYVSKINKSDSTKNWISIGDLEEVIKRTRMPSFGYNPFWSIKVDLPSDFLELITSNNIHLNIIAKVDPIIMEAGELTFPILKIFLEDILERLQTADRIPQGKHQIIIIKEIPSTLGTIVLEQE